MGQAGVLRGSSMAGVLTTKCHPGPLVPPFRCVLWVDSQGTEEELGEGVGLRPGSWKILTNVPTLHSDAKPASFFPSHLRGEGKDFDSSSSLIHSTHPKQEDGARENLGFRHQGS